MNFKNKVERPNKSENQIDLNFKQKLVYFGIPILIQLFQLTGVIIISIINKSFYEFIGIYLGLIGCSYLLGIVLAFMLSILASIEERVNTKVTLSDNVGNTKIDLETLSIDELKNLCTKNCFSETDTEFLIDFIKNPKGLKKYEIAIKYNYERSYIYQRARKLIKILGDK